MRFLIGKYIIPTDDKKNFFSDSSDNEVLLRSFDAFKFYTNRKDGINTGNTQLQYLKNYIGSNKLSVTEVSYDPDNVAFERDVKLNINMTLDLLKSEDYIEGEVTKSQIFLESLFNKNANLFGEVFQNVWLKLYSNNYELRKYLCIASCMEYEMLKDKADVLVLGGASHADPFVNEAALRAAEAWSDPKFLIYFEQIRVFEFDWLNDYKKSVIEYLEHLK